MIGHGRRATAWLIPLWLTWFCLAASITVGCDKVGLGGDRDDRPSKKKKRQSDDDDGPTQREERSASEGDRVQVIAGLDKNKLRIRVSRAGLYVMNEGDPIDVEGGGVRVTGHQWGFCEPQTNSRLALDSVSISQVGCKEGGFRGMAEVCHFDSPARAEAGHQEFGRLLAQRAILEVGGPNLLTVRVVNPRVDLALARKILDQIVAASAKPIADYRHSPALGARTTTTVEPALASLGWRALKKNVDDEAALLLVSHPSKGEMLVGLIGASSPAHAEHVAFQLATWSTYHHVTHGGRNVLAVKAPSGSPESAERLLLDLAR